MPIRVDPADQVTIDSLSAEIIADRLPVEIYSDANDTALDIDAGGALTVELTKDLMSKILTQLKIMNIHLEAITGISIGTEDIPKE
jgi:hypothetical protein